MNLTSEILFVFQEHNGHKFFTELFKVATVCEYCNDPIPILEKGEVCVGTCLYKYTIYTIHSISYILSAKYV